jgi:NodT family efflux transporter outer membrane factor (OMF) lipoprotein
VRSEWWKLYDDQELDTLETKVAVSNQTLKAAYQAYMRSRQQVKVDRSSLFPTVGIGAAGSRDRVSANRPFILPNTRNTYSDMNLEGQVSWEPDLWGSIRRTVESSSALAQASNAELAYATLSLQSELAVDYFQLRGLDSQQQLLDETVTAYRKYVELTTLRLQSGLSSDSDLALAQTQLDQTIAQATDIGVARAQYEDAIATLIGLPASSFTLKPVPMRLVLPAIPTGLPSELLERRPDIAAAERRIDSANAQIGIAQAAFYPTLNLNGAGGFESVNVGTWLQGPSALWALGASASETLFDAGRRRAVKAQAIASYEQTTAIYRETVLQAFQEVEDNLAASDILERESGQQARAVDDAQHSLSLSTGLYKTGLTNYLQLIIVQTTLLANQRTAVDISARQATASVQLFTALGGGWNVTQLPKP